MNKALIIGNTKLYKVARSRLTPARRANRRWLRRLGPRPFRVSPQAATLTNRAAAFISGAKVQYHNTIVHLLELYFYLSKKKLTGPLLRNLVLLLCVFQKKSVDRWRCPAHTRRPLSIPSKFFDRLRVLSYFRRAREYFQKRADRRSEKLQTYRASMHKKRRRLTLLLLKMRAEKPKFGYYALKRYEKKISDIKARISSLPLIYQQKARLIKKAALRGRGHTNKKRVSRRSAQKLQFFAGLVNNTLKRGHKKRAIRLVLRGFRQVRRRLKLRRPTMFYLGIAMKKINPFFILRKHSIGRRTFTIPFPLVGRKKIPLMSRLFVRAVSRRSENSFRRRFSEELGDIFSGRRKPASVKLKNEIIKSAIDNKNNIRFLNVRKRR